MLRHRSGRSALSLVAGLFLLVALPAAAAAHAELQTPTPKDGATVEGQPAEISGTYNEEMDPGGSSLKLESADGTTVASGGVDASDDKRMAITDIPQLAPGVYTVRSTTKSAEDGDIDRKTWSFTVEAAATASPTAAPTATASASVAATPTATAVASATPAPSASGGGAPASSGGDVILPIVAAVAILVVAAIWFTRRGRTSPGA